MTPSLEELRLELASFPQGRNDDQVDSFVMLLDVLGKMVVSGQQAFSAPLGTFIKDESLTGSLMFTGKPLAADPKGWQGDFGSQLNSLGWKGFGE